MSKNKQQNFEATQKRFNTALKVIDKSIKDREEGYSDVMHIWLVTGVMGIFIHPLLPIMGLGIAATTFIWSKDKTLKDLHQSKAKICEDFAKQTPALPAPERLALPAPRPQADGNEPK